MKTYIYIVIDIENKAFVNAIHKLHGRRKKDLQKISS
jgi:hypothetical protein